MKSKTFVLGISLTIMAVVLLGSHTLLSHPKYGFDLGEQIPSIEVYGNDEWRARTTESDSTILVVWSTKDATSRLVNSWLSRAYEHSNAQLLSLCIDANQVEAELYAQWDNAKSNTTIIGMLSNTQMSNRLKENLTDNATGKVFYTSQGVIHEIQPVDELWRAIQQQQR